MTRYEKCDSCRRRKVKCDEVHPTCGPCFIGDRSCTYTNGRDRGFVAFVDCRTPGGKPRRGDICSSECSSSLDESGPREQSHESTTRVTFSTKTKAVYEAGAYHTLIPGKANKGQIVTARLPSPEQPSLEATGLILRWKSFGELICPGEPQPYNFCEWGEEMPQFLGHSRALDLALDCLITGAISFVNKKQTDAARAQAQLGKALPCLREAMRSNNCRAIQDLVLLAINLVMLAEFYMRLSDGNYKIHIRGGNHLMDHVTQQGTKWTTNGRKMFYANQHSDFHSAVFEGRDSIFDRPTWLATQSPEFEGDVYPSAESVEKRNMQREVRLPRLIRLVRGARESPEDVTARAKATQVATDMYLDNLEPWVEQLRELGFFWEVPTSSPDDMSLIAESYFFKSMRVIRPLLQYWVHRCVICNLVLSLCEIFPAMPSPYQFDPAVVAAEHIRTAECIAMSTQYAIATSSPLPMNAFRQQQWLNRSFGAWWRLEHRATSIAETERAVDMQLWIIRTSDAISEMGLGVRHTMESSTRLHNVIAGGPLPLTMAR